MLTAREYYVNDPRPSPLGPAAPLPFASRIQPFLLEAPSSFIITCILQHYFTSLTESLEETLKLTACFIIYQYIN